MYNLITIGDPVIDTHVQIGDDCKDCRVEGVNMDRLCLTYGAKIPIEDSFQSLGGNAANVAAGAAKLGLNTAIIATIGDDSNGKIILDQLKKFKIDSSFVMAEAGASSRYSVVLNYRSERTILTYSEKRKYIWPEPVPETDWLYYSGLSQGYDDLQNKMLTYLAAHPTVKLALNPGSYFLKFALKNLRELIGKADLLIVNLQEAEIILGKKLEQEKSETALLNELLELGAKEVVLTDGGRGAWASNGEEAWFLPPYPVKVISKTGAGDAFSAAYLTARHLGHDIAPSLEWGTSNSCGVIQAHGPQAGLLAIKGIENMIEKFSEIKPVAFT